MIQVYGVNNMMDKGDSDRKHIKITMIPFHKEKPSELKIIWQGIKEDNKYKIVDQLINKYHNLDVDNIVKIIERSRVVKKLNQQSEILSVCSDDQELFDTETTRNYYFVKTLLSNTTKTMSLQEFLDNKRLETIIKQNQIKKEEEEKMRLEEVIKQNEIYNNHKKVMVDIKKDVILKKTPFKKKRMYNFNEKEDNLRKIILLQNSSVPLYQNLLIKPNRYEIRSKINNMNQEKSINCGIEKMDIMDYVEENKSHIDKEVIDGSLQNDNSIKVKLKNKQFNIDFDKLKIYIQRYEWDEVKKPIIEEIPLFKNNTHSMVFPNEMCDIKRYKRRRKIKKMNYLKVYSKIPNIKILQHNTIDEETISILKSPDFKWMDGFIPKLNNFYINSPYNGNENNILLRFQGDSERSTILIKTPIDLYCSELQAKLHFITRACYGWPSITNIDFSDMPLHQYFDDFFIND